MFRELNDCPPLFRSHERFQTLRTYDTLFGVVRNLGEHRVKVYRPARVFLFPACPRL